MNQRSIFSSPFSTVHRRRIPSLKPLEIKSVWFEENPKINQRWTVMNSDKSLNLIRGNHGA